MKRELKARGLSTAGNKNELIDRLQNSLKTKCEDVASVESADDLEEDLLNVSFVAISDIDTLFFLHTFTMFLNYRRMMMSTWT